MNIMNEYTYNQIKKNKRHTISILVAVTIASALMFSLCIFLFSYWHSKVDTIIKAGGYWHGELNQSISGDKLKAVEDNPEVEAVMVKGSWITIQVPDAKKPYFLLRDGNQEFWQDMNLKNSLSEGRLPETKDEIVVAKQFFEDNPSYKIGDELELPVGNRMAENQALETRDYKKEEENFDITGTRKCIIVGELDISAISAYPGYIAMGYMDTADVQPSDELTVYMRFKHPRRIYETLPAVAEDAGLTKDERGQYAIKYNTELLSLYGINEKGSDNSQLVILIAMAVILVVLVMGTFILIIYNAFSLSANSRVKELSILKSLGATPKQIKYSVLYEGFILWLIQSPVGIIIGYLFSYGIFSRMNGILKNTQDYKNMSLSFSWIVVAFSLLVSLITVLISASIPGRKMAKVPAVEGIEQSSSKVKKQRNHRILNRLFGMEGELAGRQFSANRKSLRTAIVSLSLCLTLIVSYVNIISIYNLAKGSDNEVIEHDMNVTLKTIDEPDPEMIKSISSLSEVKDSVIHRSIRGTTIVDSSQESEEFKAVGGFESIPMKYSVSKEDDDKYKIIVYIAGLSDDSFRNYCNKIGVDADKYYSNQNMGILMDNTYHVSEESNDLVKVPMLNWDTKNSVNVSEQIFDFTQGNYEADMKIGDVTQVEPGDLDLCRYSTAIIMPMEKYQQIAANFIEDRKLEANSLSIDLLVGDENSAEVKEKIDKICNSYLGSDDYTIWSLLEDKQQGDLKQKATSVAVYGVAIMIGVIGIFNAFTTISNNLQVHKREYAMLRSVGLTPEGLNKILLLEGMSFALYPVVISIPFILAICSYMLNMTTISWGEFMKVFKGWAVLAYTSGIFASIFLAYYLSSKKVKEGNIIEAIKNEIV